MHNFSIFQWMHVFFLFFFLTVQTLLGGGEGVIFSFSAALPLPFPFPFPPGGGVTKVALVTLYTMIQQYTQLALLCAWLITHTSSYRYRLQYLHHACMHVSCTCTFRDSESVTCGFLVALPAFPLWGGGTEPATGTSEFVQYCTTILFNAHVQIYIAGNLSRLRLYLPSASSLWDHFLSPRCSGTEPCAGTAV